MHPFWQQDGCYLLEGNKLMLYGRIPLALTHWFSSVLCLNCHCEWVVLKVLRYDEQGELTPDGEETRIVEITGGDLHCPNCGEQLSGGNETRGQGGRR